LLDEVVGELPFAEPAGLEGVGDLGDLEGRELFDLGEAGADGGVGIAELAELVELAVERFHGAGVGGEEFGLAGEEEGALAGFGFGDGGLELAEEADGAAVLAGEQIGLGGLLPVEIDGADAERKHEGADENVDDLIERRESRRPFAHWLIMARMAVGLHFSGSFLLFCYAGGYGSFAVSGGR